MRTQYFRNLLGSTWILDVEKSINKNKYKDCKDAKANAHKNQT